MMSSALVFVIPVRHHQSVSDWGMAKHHLGLTLASIAAQTGGRWECRVVANAGADLPPLPANCSLRSVDFPLPVLPDRKQARFAYYEAIRKDKGLRIHAGMRDVSPDQHVMVVDFDDAVSNRLADFVTRNRAANGWVIQKGYIWSGGKWCLRTNQFNRVCGTSVIVRRDLLGPLEMADGTPDLEPIKRYLGSHIYLKQDLAAAGTPLSVLPFAGAAYRVGNPQSTSGSGDLLRALPLRYLAKHPKALLCELSGLQPLKAETRGEFLLAV